MTVDLKIRDACFGIGGLVYHDPEGRTALNGIDLSLWPGEKVALVGPNGAGKSTLLLHLNGILPASSGSVRVFGKEMAKDNLARIGRPVVLEYCV